MIADSEATTKAATIAISKSVDFISSRENRVVKTLNIVYFVLEIKIDLILTSNPRGIGSYPTQTTWVEIVGRNIKL